MNLRIKISIYVLSGIISLMFLCPSSYALGLKKEYSIPLEKTAVVYGSMRGNYLIYNRPNITMHDIRGKQIYTKKLKNNVKPTISPNGYHLGLIKYADHSPTSLRTIQLAMYDKRGKFRWKIDNPPGNEFIITDGGRIYGIEGIKGLSARIHAYDEYGDLAGIVLVKEYHGLEIAPGGKKFIIDRALNGLDVHDSTGILLATLPKSTHYSFDKDDQYIGTFFLGKFHLYRNEEEVQVIKTEDSSIKNMAINVEKNIVVLLSVNRMEVYELTTGKQLWQYNFINEKRNYTNLDLSDDAEYFVCGMDINQGTHLQKEDRHIKGLIFIVPTNGATLYQKHLTYKNWGVGLPRALINSTNTAVYAITKEEVIKFRIK